jgi:hypothetical protein
MVPPKTIPLLIRVLLSQMFTKKYNVTAVAQDQNLNICLIVSVINFIMTSSKGFSISCPATRPMVFYRAFYGRFHSNPTCEDPNALFKLRNYCVNGTYCWFTTGTTPPLTDNCPSLAKYLDFDFECAGNNLFNMNIIRFFLILKFLLKHQRKM